MTSMPTSLTRTSLCLLGLLAFSSANADGPVDAQWGLGAAVGFERKAYRDFDDKAQVLPLVLYESRWVRLIGPVLDVKLASDESLSLGLRLRYAGDGYEAEDSPFLQGMAERKSSFWFGGAASWRTSWATLSAELLGDASRESKGRRASLGLERTFTTGDFQFAPRLVAHRLDGKYVDYYYGVRAGEATPLRPFHGGAATTNVEAGLRIGYSVAPQHTLSADLSMLRLGSGLRNSPLVDRSTQSGIRLGYLYLF